MCEKSLQKNWPNIGQKIGQKKLGKKLGELGELGELENIYGVFT